MATTRQELVPRQWRGGRGGTCPPSDQESGGAEGAPTVQGGAKSAYENKFQRKQPLGITAPRRGAPFSSFTM